MSFNTERVGKQIVKINGGKYNGKIISVSDNIGSDEISHNFKDLILKEGKFQHIPNPDLNREVLYICGPSGSGKSTYTKNFITEWKKLHKTYDVFLISPFKEDPSIDALKPKRVKLDESLIDDPILCEHLKDSCIIFDDIDSISDKAVRKAVYKLLFECLEIGRHYNITVVQTNHILCAGNDTKRILNECHHITFFPHSGSKKTIEYLCKNYGGLDRKDISKIKKLKSRWATIHRNYPISISTENGIFIPDSGDSDEE